MRRSENPLHQITTSAYDPANRQTLRLDARDVRTSYQYDPVGRQTGVRYPDGTRVTTLYNAVGKRLLCHDWIGRYTRTWDPLDRIHVSQNPYGGTLTFTWDAASQRRRLVDPLGGLTTTVYNAAGRLSRLVDPQDGRTTYAYDPAGRRTEKRLANGTRTSFSYDAADHLTQVDNLTSVGSPIAGFAYAYDPAGNRVGVVESAGDRVTWTYDAANQLSAEHRTGVAGFRHTFAYDPAGNRTLKNEDSDRTTFTYDPANRLQRSAAFSGTTTYTYDAAGNQRTIEEPTGDVVTNTWSYENQNTLVEQPSGDRVTLTYNGDRMQVAREDADEARRFEWDKQNLLLETDDLGTPIARNTHEPDEYGRLVSREDLTTSEPAYYHYDALGSTAALSDQSELVGDEYQYKAWGEQTAPTADPQPYRWVGELGYRYDEDTNRHNLRRRDYESHIARFLSQDPPEGDDDPNKYWYARNNPTNLVDPEGTEPGSTLTGAFQGALKVTSEAYPTSPRLSKGEDCRSYRPKPIEPGFALSDVLSRPRVDPTDPAYDLRTDEEKEADEKNARFKRLMDEMLKDLGLTTIEEMVQGFPYHRIAPYLDEAVSKGTYCSRATGNGTWRFYLIPITLGNGKTIRLHVIQTPGGYFNNETYQLTGFDDGTTPQQELCNTFNEEIQKVQQDFLWSLVPGVGSFMACERGEFVDATLSIGGDLLFAAGGLGLIGKGSAWLSKLVKGMTLALGTVKSAQALNDLLRGRYAKGSFELFEALMIFVSVKIHADEVASRASFQKQFQKYIDEFDDFLVRTKPPAGRVRPAITTKTQAQLQSDGYTARTRDGHTYYVRNGELWKCSEPCNFVGWLDQNYKTVTPPVVPTPEKDVARGTASNAARQRIAGQIEEVARRRSLGTDPKRGHLPHEEAAAIKLEQQEGITLCRDATGNADWIGPNNASYDLLGPFPQQFLPAEIKKGNLLNAFQEHTTGPKTDFAVADFSGLDAAGIQQVESVISQLTPAQQARIIRLK